MNVRLELKAFTVLYTQLKYRS